MNSQERSIWSDFLVEYQKALQALQMVGLYRSNMALVLSHALAYKIGIDLPTSNQEDRFKLFKGKLSNMDQWIKWLDSGELGLTLRAGDFDIVAPIGTNTDRLALYKNPGFAGLPLIIAGIVVVASIVAYVVLIRSELSRLGDEYDKLIKVADSKFCADPSSAGCAAWLSKKDSSDFYKNESTIDTIKRKLASAVETVGRGLGAGVMIAIPVLLLWLATRKK